MQAETAHRTVSTLQPTINFDAIPPELRHLDQWVLWKLDPDEKGKPTKVPYQVTGSKALTDNPNTWQSFDIVLETFRQTAGQFNGIGFVLSSSHCGMDLDDCRNPKSGQFEEWAQKIIEAMPGYWEVSPSGTGAKGYFIGQFKLPKGKNTGFKIPYRTGSIEAYNSGRYFAVTGQCLEAAAADLKPLPKDGQQVIDKVWQYHLSTKNKKRRAAGDNAGGKSLDELSEKQREILDEHLEAVQLAEVGYRSEADWAFMKWAVKCALSPGAIWELCKDSGKFADKGNHARGYFDITYNNALASVGVSRNGTPGASGESYASDTEGEGRRKKYELTEVGNSERFFDINKGQLKFNHTSNRWHIWDGSRWAEDETKKTESFVKNISKAILKEAANTDDKKDREEITKHALKSESAKVLTNTLNLARSKQEWAVRSEWMDQDHYLFNLLNGTIELTKKGFNFREHRREDNITKIANLKYDPQATCPLWEKFTERIFRTPEGTSDPELTGFIRRALALSLTGDTSAQVLFFAYGTGSNGKSTLFEAAKILYGDYYQKAPIDMLLAKKNTSIPNDIARLVGTRFVVSNETQSGRRINEAIVKDLTGGDTIAARFLRHEFFEFEPTHKLWIYGNHKPIVKNNDDGIWRRLLLIPFEQKIDDKEKDEHLKDKLVLELSGILNWILQGWSDYCKNGLNVPGRVKVASRAYRDEMNNAHRFLAECCEFKTTHTITVKTLYDTYRLWCDSNGEFPVKKSEFKDRVMQEGLPEPDRSNQNKLSWQGVKLTQETINEFHPNEGSFL